LTWTSWVFGYRVRETASSTTNESSTFCYRSTENMEKYGGEEEDER